MAKVEVRAVGRDPIHRFDDEAAVSLRIQDVQRQARIHVHHLHSVQQHAAQVQPAMGWSGEHKHAG